MVEKKVSKRPKYSVGRLPAKASYKAKDASRCLPLFHQYEMIHIGHKKSVELELKDMNYDSRIHLAGALNAGDVVEVK